MTRFFGRRKVEPADSVDRLGTSLAATAASLEEFALREVGQSPEEAAGDLRWAILSEWLAFLFHAVDRYAFSEAGDAARQRILDELTPVAIDLSIQMMWPDADDDRCRKIKAWTLDRIAEADAELVVASHQMGDDSKAVNVYNAETALAKTIRRVQERLTGNDDFWFHMKLRWHSGADHV